MRLTRRVLSLLTCAAFAAPRQIIAQYSYVPSPPPCPVPPPPRPAAARLAPDTRTVVVLALHLVRANPSDRYLADAFPDIIARRLATLKKIWLFSPYAVRRIAPISAPNAARVAREIGTRYVVTGTLTSQNGSPVLEVVLFDSSAAAPLWSRQFSINDNALAAAESLSTSEVARRVVPNLSAAETAGMFANTTRSAPAFQRFLRAEDASRERGAGYSQRAADLFRQTVVIDSTFGEAHTSLTMSLLTTIDDGWRDALTAADSVEREAVHHGEIATRLAPGSARAWAAKGIALSYVRGRWSDSRAALDQARKLDSRDPEVAWLRGRALLRMGMRREAEESFRIALQLSPSFAPALLDLGDLALADGRPELACGWLNAAVVADPYRPQSYALRAIARRKERDMRLSWSDAEIAIRLGGRTAGEAAYALVDSRDGDSTRAKGRALKLFRELDRRTRIGGSEARLAALALIAVGEQARAVSLLERAYPRDGILGNALASPAFASLKSNDRFRRILNDIVAITDERTGVRGGGK